MNIIHGHQEKSRLGRLLVGRGYLSEAQLDEGLLLQRETGQRLGEVFVQSGWITERELYRVLKHQARYRNAAAFVAMVTLPFQPLVSLAATNNGTTATKDSEAAEVYEKSGFSPLSEDEMASVSGAGSESLMDRIAVVSRMGEAASNSAQTGEPLSEAESDAVEGLKLVANVFVPVLNFLDSELTISGVHYRDDVPRYQVHEDGKLTLALPERIEEIRMDNIRVSGNEGPSMGNVSIHNIRFHPDSSMTIYTR